MEGQFEKLEIIGYPFQFVPYPVFAKVSEIEDGLEDFDSRYNPNEITKSQLQNIPSISNFISSSDHLRIIEYTLEYRLCVKQGCILCAKIVSGVRTPDISTKGKNIRGKLLQWMELLVVDPLDKAHLLLIDETRAYINKITPSLEELMSNLPSVKEDKITNKVLQRESTRTSN